MGTKKGKQWFFIEKKAKRQTNGIDKVNIVFWNVAGLTRKDKDFSEYIQDFDYVALLERWVDVIRWDKIKPLLPKGYNWRCQYVKKEKKSRATGGINNGCEIKMG